MKILESNLNNFIKSPKNILDITNNHIAEVESYKKYIDINNLKVGLVKSVEKHENADTLFVTKVDLGEKVEQIVCGAKNVKEGQYVIVATEGAILPGDFLIKPTKLRGVESNGMICSLEELGFNEENIEEKYKDGIFYFNEPKEIGSNPISHLYLDGYIMELDLTPNRNDLLSHYGFARDLAAVLKTNITLPKFDIKESNQTNPLTVNIESKNTNSYYARYFDNIEIKDSPLWLKGFLEAMGTSPINNVVDITNYILFTYGIPMHAFDALKFNSNEIVVKDNNKKQEVLTLDDSKITIEKDEILITNGKDIMALGGIMGLDNSKVDDNTKEIILEVASFDPLTIRETSKKLNLRSDSSLRFERGIDESIMMTALNHATHLLEKYASATTYKGIAKDIEKTYENETVKINLNEIKEKIGKDIKIEEIIEILKHLNYSINKIDNLNYEVVAPTYRRDIKIAEDVLEEVLRIYGMDKVKTKSLINTSSKGLTNKQKNIRTLRSYLSNIGFHEVVTYSLMEKENVKLFNDIGEELTVLKPMSSERTTLRQSVINGLIKTYNYNKARKNKHINLFEIGNVYAKDVEEKVLSILLSESLTYNNLKDYNIKIDFYYLSGILKNIFNLLSVDYKLEASTKNSLHPYQQANIIVNNNVVGFIGKLHPKEYKDDIFVLEINLDKIKKPNKFKYESLTKYPNVFRDIAFIIDDNIKIDEIIEKIKQTGTKTLINVELFDVYKGKGIKEGYKSLAFNLTFNDKEKTLSSEDVEKLVGRIIKRFKHEYNIEVRE